MKKKFQIKSFKTKILLKLAKKSNFKLTWIPRLIKISSLSLDEQREYIKDRTEEIERIKVENSPKLLIIPIDVVDDEELKSQFMAKG